MTIRFACLLASPPQLRGRVRLLLSFSISYLYMISPVTSCIIEMSILLLYSYYYLVCCIELGMISCPIKMLGNNGIRTVGFFLSLPEARLKLLALCQDLREFEAWSHPCFQHDSIRRSSIRLSSSLQHENTCSLPPPHLFKWPG